MTYVDELYDFGGREEAAKAADANEVGGGGPAGVPPAGATSEETAETSAEPTAENPTEQAREEGRKAWTDNDGGDDDGPLQGAVDEKAARAHAALDRLNELFDEEAIAMIKEDPEAMLNSPMLSDEHKEAIQEYAEAMAALDGVKEVAQEAAEQNQAEVENEVVKATNKETKTIVPATIKDDSGNPVKVYVSEGEIVQNEAGGIDVQKSSQSIVVYDPNTGKYRIVDPHDILVLGQAVSPADAVQSATEAIQQRHKGIFDHAEQAAQQQKPLPAPEGENGGTPPTASAKVDNQGNPIDDNGKLITEKVSSVDELTDEDFTAPTRSVQLPELPQKVADVLGTGGKPVIIKKNIFERNLIRHGELTPDDSRKILSSALYNPDLYGQNQKSKRPYNWVVINTTDGGGPNRLVLLEINPNKENVEIVHWHYIDEDGLNRIKRQAADEDEQLLILPSVKEEAGALSSPISGLPKGKVSTNTAELQGGGENKQPIVMGSGALASIPKNEKGEPIYEQAEPATAWQAILEETEGDTDMAASVVGDMIADKEAAVKKAEKAKPKHADTVAGKIAAQKEHKAAVERAKAELEAWKKIAAAKDEHEKAVAEQKAEEAKKKDEERHAAAVAQAEQDKAEQQRKEEEQQAVGEEKPAEDKGPEQPKDGEAAEGEGKTEGPKSETGKQTESAGEKSDKPTEEQDAEAETETKPTEGKEEQKKAEAEGKKPTEETPEGTEGEKPSEDTPKTDSGESEKGAGEGEDVRADKNPSLGDAINTLYEKGKVFASKIYKIKFFDIAKTPDFMKRLGITGSKFTIRYGVIARHFGKDGSHDFTKSEWEQLPKALEKPFAITRLADKENGFRIYTTLKTEKGEYVIVGVDVKNAGRDVEVNAIATLFGRRKGAHLSENEEVVYRSETITPEQESLLSRPNSDQYPPERESSEGKDSASEPNTQEGGGNSAVAVKKKPKTKPKDDDDDGPDGPAGGAAAGGGAKPSGGKGGGAAGAGGVKSTYERKKWSGTASLDEMKERLAHLEQVLTDGTKERAEALPEEADWKAEEKKLRDQLDAGEISYGEYLDKTLALADGRYADFFDRKYQAEDEAAELRALIKLGSPENKRKLAKKFNGFLLSLLGKGPAGVSTAEKVLGRPWGRSKETAAEFVERHHAAGDLSFEAKTLKERPKNWDSMSDEERDYWEHANTAYVVNGERMPEAAYDYAKYLSEKGGGTQATRPEWPEGGQKPAKPSEPTAPSTAAEKPKEPAKGADGGERKIEDVGEHIAGARKDALAELSKSVADVTLESLIELPTSKAFKRPDLKKAVKEGALREEDARFAEAVMAAFLGTAKPKLKEGYKRASSEAAVRKWAEHAKAGVDLLAKLFSLDEKGRDELMARVRGLKMYSDEAVEARKRQLEQWNPGQKFNGTCYPLNPVDVLARVMERLDYEPGQKVTLPVVAAAPASGFDHYILTTRNGKRYYPGRHLATIDDVVDEMVYAAKVENADPDTDHPAGKFSVMGVGEPLTKPTGKWRVLTQGGFSGTPKLHTFDSKEEAEAFAEKYKAGGKNRYASTPSEQTRTVGYTQYEIVYKHDSPTKGTYENMPTGKVYDSLEEARAAIDGEHDALNEAVNAKLAEGKKKGGGRKKDYVQILSYTEDGGRTWKYGVALADKYAPPKTAYDTMPFYLGSGFSSLKEAQAFVEEHREEWDAKIADIDRARRDFVYFSGTGERTGEDWRKGADVSAEQLMEQFGFRGVQFGNWANQRDRQAAVNGAFDALMDLAQILGVSPRALSLNGELGLAFGARGGGSAAAHYEPGEVVINLTKTQGAGSLAHEWWHALDNYFARHGNVKGGYVTESKGIEMRDELRAAFNALIDSVAGSDYNTRSRQRGASYWGRPAEETARLFAAWVNDELQKRGMSSPFLSDTDPGAAGRYAETMYEVYKVLAGDKAMTLEEFKKTPLALAGFAYPSAEELATFGERLRNIFNTVQEKVDEQTGKTLLYHRGPVVAEPDEAEQALLEVVNDAVRATGIKVGTDVDKGQKLIDMANGKDVRMEAKKRRALETASLGEEPRSLTVVSSADGTKVLNNIDKLATQLEKSATQPKTFIGDVAKALGATRHGSSSEYATFETKNGKIVTIRLANHSAKVSNFDKNGEEEGISIVVSPRPNTGIEDDGNAHVVEYYYNAIALRRAEGKPLADIVRSIKQTLYSGEFKDTTGLAERQEVNGKEVARYQKVYHGSGADFDEFDHSHMGEGTGLQAHGWGTYVLVNESPAKGYAVTDAAERNEGNALLEWHGQEADADSIMEELAEVYPETFGEWFDGKWNNPYRHRFEHLLDRILDGKDVEEDVYFAKRDEQLSEKEREFWSAVYRDVLPHVSVDMPHHRNLYEVQVPDNDGRNYLEEYKTYSAGTALRRGIEAALKERGVEGLGKGSMTGQEIYWGLTKALGSQKEASRLLQDLGLVGVHYYRQDDGESYVIFNEKDAKITDHVRFFRTPDGEAYGFTVGGEIYVDPRIARADTPIHEYTHLWGDMMRRVNPKAWADIVRLMKGKNALWDWVKENYPELKTDDEIADEALAQFSGKRGAGRLREEMRKVAEGDGSITKKAAAISALQRVKEAIGKFWRGVAELLHIRFTTAEEVADRVLNDLLHGVNPRKVHPEAGNAERDGKVRYQFIGKRGAEQADHAEEVSTRLDNLSVARKMEADKKDAKAIKMATGWERGADGKWRYEIPDLKLKDVKAFDKNSVSDRAELNHLVKQQPWYAEYEKLADKDFDAAYDNGEPLTPKERKRLEELEGINSKFKENYAIQHTSKERPHLADWIDAPDLFKAYPDLKTINVLFTDQLPNNVGGRYIEKENLIEINSASIEKDIESTMAHEIQHAIQHAEGFAKGGSVADVRQRFEAAKREWRARSWAAALRDKAEEMGEHHNQLAVEKALLDEYKEMGMDNDKWMPDKETREKGFNYFARGYADRSLDSDIKHFRLDESVRSDFNPFAEYTSLGGEVEARNVEKRMNMTPEQRRASLAEETEDVAREDQIFLSGTEEPSSSESRRETVNNGEEGGDPDEGKRFRLLDDDDPKAQELESLPEGELVPVYRNVQVFEDDTLGSPMAFTDAVTGERRTLEGGKWNYSEPREVKLTPEQQKQLDELNKNGYLMVNGKKTTELQISDSLKFVKPKNGEATLQYLLKKSPEDSGLWAAYNPYDHAIETPLNTQFSSAYKRPNLVVVRSLVPKSELEGHYKADYAKDSTGAHKWNNGRTLYLSRYSKIDKVLTREEEAKLIDEYWKKNPGKREALTTHRDYRRFVPAVRRALEDMGYRFELDGKELTPEEARELDRQQENAEPAIPGDEGRVPRVGPEDIARINAKMSGKWVGEPKETMAQSMVRRVKELAAKLGVKVRIVTSADELAKSPSRRQRKMKGMYDTKTGEVTIVIGNHENLADVENTVLHEVVGHRGFRILFKTKEAFDHAMDELYRVSSEKIRKWIDDKARKLYDEEVDRIMARKRKERKANGEKPSDHHLEDMTAAHIEASKKKDQFRREATEEYGAHLAGRIGEKGFEKMSAEEQTFWGRLKSMLQKALQRLAEGLNITSKHEWTDKDWAYVLHEAYKREKNGGKPSIFDEADTIAMRMRTGFGEGKEEEHRSEESGSVEEVNQKFNDELDAYENKSLPQGHRFDLGMPSPELVSAGFPRLPISMRSSVIGVKSNMARHMFTPSDLKDLVKAMQKPIAVFNYTKDNMRNVIVDLERGGKHFLVGVTLGYKGNGIEINSVSGLFPKDSHEWIKWIQDDKAIRIDQKEKVLNLIDSLRTNPAESARIGLDLDNAANIVQGFENPKLPEENVSDEGKMFRDSEDEDPDEGMMFRDGDDDDIGDLDFDLGDAADKMREAAVESNANNLHTKREAMKAIGGNLSKLRQAMARQKVYDKGTVKSVTDMAREMLKNGMLDKLSSYEAKRILSAAANVTGAEAYRQYCEATEDAIRQNKTQGLTRLLALCRA